MSPAATAAYSPGLEGVIAGSTALSSIDAQRNVLSYRGYNVQDLCDRASFEEVAYLLLNGELPSAEQLSAFNRSLLAYGSVPDEVYTILRRLPSESAPMDWLKVGVAALGAFEPPAILEGQEANKLRALRLIAQMPGLVANGWRVIHGAEPVYPDPGLSHASRFFQMLEDRPPDPFFEKVLNATLILYAEHGFNASTFSARVTVSTLSDLHSGVVSAIGTLKGPLHGGANEEVMHMLLEIGEPERAEEWLRRKLTKTPENPRPRIMGFGHREYKSGDQRAQIVKGYTEELARRTGKTKWTRISAILEEIMLREKGLHPNLDFPVSPAYYMMGLPIPLYTPIFVVSRIVGWCGHILEQLANNRLIRPSNLYDGPAMRDFVPLGDRA